MTIPYRVRQFLKHAATALLLFLILAVFVWLIWLLWLDRFVVYTRDQGAILNFDLPAQNLSGLVAEPPEPEATISIYYNEGDDQITTGNELRQLIGYYVDKEALEKDLDTVRAQILALPLGTPVLVDVKSIYGNFFYSSSVSDKRNTSLDTEAMDQLIQLLNSGNLYTIARLPAFRDYNYGLEHVSDGLPVSGGYLWMDDDRCYWLNPTTEGTMTYLVQIVTELRDLGFDEVVFSDFRFPDTNSIVFSGDKTAALATAAQTLVTSCATDRFAVSFTGQSAAFPLPEGRSRLYLEHVAAAEAASVAVQTGLADPTVNLVFLTEVNDTRFDTYGVLRPLSSAH